MTKHQLKLADRQCRMAELSQRVQDLVVILATSLWAGAAVERSRPGRGRYPLPGPDAQADRRAGPPTPIIGPSPSWARRSPRAASRPSPASRPSRS